MKKKIPKWLGKVGAIIGVIAVIVSSIILPASASVITSNEPTNTYSDFFPIKSIIYKQEEKDTPYYVEVTPTNTFYFDTIVAPNSYDIINGYTTDSAITTTNKLERLEFMNSVKNISRGRLWHKIYNKPYSSGPRQQGTSQMTFIFEDLVFDYAQIQNGTSVDSSSLLPIISLYRDHQYSYDAYTITWEATYTTYDGKTYGTYDYVVTESIDLGLTQEVDSSNFDISVLPLTTSNILWGLNDNLISQKRIYVPDNSGKSSIMWIKDLKITVNYDAFWKNADGTRTLTLGDIRYMTVWRDDSVYNIDSSGSWNIEGYLRDNAPKFTETIYEEIIITPDADFSSWLVDAVGGFFDFEIFPGFSISNIFIVVVSILLIVAFLKIFAGG